jgi:hypothetical protein
MFPEECEYICEVMMRMHVKAIRLFLLNEIIRIVCRHKLPGIVYKFFNLFKGLLFLRSVYFQNAMSLEDIKDCFSTLEGMNVILAFKPRWTQFLYIMQKSSPFHYVLFIFIKF